MNRHHGYGFMLHQILRQWVQFLVWVHAWIVDSVLSWGVYERQPINVSLALMFLYVSLPLLLSPFLSL